MSGYLFIIRHENGAWGAHSPDLPGLLVVAGSRNELDERMVSALQFHLEALRDEGQEIPEPSAEIVDVVRVTERGVQRLAARAA